MYNQETVTRVASQLFILAFALVMIILARPLLIPLISAMLLSFLLLPISQYLENKGVFRGIAILISIILCLAVIGSLVTFFYYQIAKFASDLPELRSNLDAKLLEFQKYITRNFHVSRWEQNVWIEDQTEDITHESGKYLSQFFAFTSSLMAGIVLIPVYIFFMTYYREKLKIFICRVTPSEHNDYMLDVARKTARVSRKYIRGLLIDILILAVLNSTGFLIIGIKYAVLLGTIAAILNLIPYLGVLIGSIFPFLIALLTKDTFSPALGVIGVCMLVQFIDNNFLTPKIVGSSVSINPLATLVAIILGGMIWGILGMMLFIPLLGMLKVILDSFPKSQPYGFLIGEEEHMKPLGRIEFLDRFVMQKK